MKKGIAILIAVFAVIGIIIGMIAGSYNGLVNQQEEVENKHSVISVQLQRRADLLRAEDLHCRNRGEKRRCGR